MDELAREHHLQGLPPEDFVERAAHYMLELNIAHPFREGNGRTIRYLLSLLAQQAGFDLDTDKLKDTWLDACIKGVGESEHPMSGLIASALVVYED